MPPSEARIPSGLDLLLGNRFRHPLHAYRLDAVAVHVGHFKPPAVQLNMIPEVDLVELPHQETAQGHKIAGRSIIAPDALRDVGKRRGPVKHERTIVALGDDRLRRSVETWKIARDGLQQ